MRVKLETVLLVAATSMACFTEAIDGPDIAEDVRISVVASGGLTGSTYTFEIDGKAGVVRALDCHGICRKPGIVVGLSDHQIRMVARALEEGGIFAYSGSDFGDACCDQVGMRIEYHNGGRSATVTGTASRYPEPLHAAATLLSQLGIGLVPAVVAFGTEPSSWPHDAVTIDSASLDGPILTLDLTYGGGCAEHAVDVVLANGWLESFPVRAGAVLSHDSRDDSCDALVHSRRTIDLTPIRRAYEAAYGEGAATVILSLAASNGTRTLEYRF